MRDLFDPHSFEPRHGARRVPTRDHRHSHYPLVLDLFDADPFRPQHGDRQLSGIRRHLEWIGRHEWPARIVIVTGELGTAPEYRQWRLRRSADSHAIRLDTDLLCESHFLAISRQQILTLARNPG
jgi:hypothetical protein